MATLTDTLTTLLKLDGLTEYLAGLALITTAVKGAATEEDRLFRAGRLFDRLGMAESFDATTHAVDRLARSSGYARNDIERVVAQLAQAGVGAGSLPKALKDISDAAAGNAQGFGFAETGDAFVKAVLGKERALEHFGITLHATGSRMANLARTEFEFEKRFGGDAGLRANTTLGAMDRLSTSFNHFFNEFGRIPAVTHILNRLADGFDRLTEAVGPVFNALQYLFPPLWLLNQAAARDHEGPAAAMGRGNRPATERTLQVIADNTNQMVDGLEKAILGGPGFRARQALTYRDVKLAMSI